MSLILQGAFEHEYPEISKHFQDLLKTCPSLAKAMDPRSMEAGEGEHHKQGSNIKADSDHVNPSALHRQKPIRQLGADFIGITKSLKLQRSHPFFAKLKQAYQRDYNKPHEVNLHQAELRWHEKVAFTTRNEKRFCFKVGDFVKISKGLPADDDSHDTRYCRLEGVITHGLTYDCHLFAVVRLARRRPQGSTDAEDVLLRGRPIHKLESEQEIVGLWRIEGEYIWMGSVEDDGLIQLEFDIDAR
ncbi:hypothetical protein E4U09_003921 [Claviceps aff. purpurea]|uniref:Uncharacterized protein n=1 Tax=Claviceps aff. purpurea TaxID=1967640 RepID=A0A9P7QFS8_9HYPO|nr:hypothetical protein E4U09_003921 [Claviceps aff. purpurea]